MKKVVSCLVQLSINPGGQRPPNARVFRICNVSLLPKLPRYEGNSIEHCIDLAKTGAALARMDQDFERAHPKRDRPAYVGDMAKPKVPMATQQKACERVLATLSYKP